MEEKGNQTYLDIQRKPTENNCGRKIIKKASCIETNRKINVFEKNRFKKFNKVLHSGGVIKTEK